MARAGRDVLAMRELARTIDINRPLEDWDEADLIVHTIALITQQRTQLREYAHAKPEGVRVNARGKPARKHPWTKEDDARLTEIYHATDEQPYAYEFWLRIAARLPLRTLGGVEWRCRQLGLPAKAMLTSDVGVPKDRRAEFLEKSPES